MPADIKANDLGFATAAQNATDAEHQMTFTSAIKLYPKAVAWSVLLSTALVMEGYDTLATLYAQSQFQSRYGTPTSKEPQISAAWRSGLSDAANVGEIIGLQFNGYFQDRFGYRKTIIGALVGVTGFIFIVFFAQSLGNASGRRGSVCSLLGCLSDLDYRLCV